jgi:dihydrofolate reductase
MRKVILQEFVSLDGMAAGPGGNIDYIPGSTAGDASFGANQAAFIDSIDAIVLGRVTYEMFAQYWPNVTSGEDKPFADRLNAIRKFVFTKTLDRAPWGKFEEARVMKGDTAETIAKMKQERGKNMVVWGSISLAQSLVKAGLVDEHQLVVCPVVLGGGRPLYRESVQGLRLLKAKSFDRGSVLLAYERGT